MSTGNKLQLHTQAVNLARRWSVQNENDLMQEDMFHNTMDSPKRAYTHDDCQEMAKHMMHLSSLPSECMKFADVKADLKRRDTDTTDATQILS